MSAADAFRRAFAGLFGSGTPKSASPFSHAALSGRGLVRPDNQDHFHADPGTGLFCVADGMGGGQGGAKASEIACREASLAPREGDILARADALGARVKSANAAIREFARNAGYSQMATTVALLSFDPANREAACVGHVGDSRIYRLRGGRLELLTRDHTVAAEMQRADKFRPPKTDAELRASPLSHILTRAVGVDREVEVEWKTIDLAKGDRFLLCSDGVYDMLDDGKIEFIMSGATHPRHCCKTLEKAILAAGAADNYTMVIVNFDI